MNPEIQVTNVTRRYGSVVALDNVSMTFRPGVITGLLGRNGAGKTVLMTLLTGQERPTEGTITVGGKNPANHEDVMTAMSFVRDNQGYPPEYKLKHLLRIAPLFRPNWDAAYAKQLIRTFEIPADRTIRKMSRGQRSAVAAVLGLASRTPVTILDEPYLGMDATARQIFCDVLIADYSEHPRTVVISTHLVHEMESLLEDVVVLDKGKVRRQGSAAELRTAAVQLTGSKNQLRPLIAGVQPIQERWLGAMGSVIVADAPEVAPAARRAGVQVEPVSLQELVAAYGRDREVQGEAA